MLLRCLTTAAVLLLGWSVSLGAAGTGQVLPSGLQWKSAENQVHAQVAGWPLSKVLGRVAAATGWEIYLEPGVQRRVNVRFQGLPPREALRRLLGDLSFSLQPQPQGPSRLYIYATERDRAVERIAVDDALPGPIPNELIVRIKPGAQVKLADLIRKWGGEIVGRVEDLDAYRLRFPTAEAAEAARKALSTLDDLASVENNYRWDPPAALTAEASAASAPGAAPLRPRLMPDGTYQVVGVIDTAVQPLASDREALILSRNDLVSGQPADDGLWHGTAMTEALFRGLELTDTSPDGTAVRVRLYNVYGANEVATTFDVTRAVYQAAQDGVTYLNLSLGGPEFSALLADALGSYSAQGGLVVVAAGNNGSPDPFYPAADPRVMAVTAVDSSGAAMPWANYGSYVDVGAPGVLIMQHAGDGWRVTGTSPASAFTAGMAAGYGSRTGVSAPQAGDVVRRDMPFQGGTP